MSFSESIKKKVADYYPGAFRKIVLMLSPYTKPSILQAAVATLKELVRNDGTCFSMQQPSTNIPHSKKSEVHFQGGRHQLFGYNFGL